MRAGGPAFEGRLGWAYLGLGLLVSGFAVALASGAVLRSEASSAIVAVVIVVGIGVLLALAQWLPGLIFTLVPVSCIFNTRQGFFPFDLVVLGLAAYAVMDAVWRKDARLPGPPALNVAFLAFLVSGMITLFMARELSSYAGAMKRLVVGYCGAVLVWRYADRQRWPWFGLSIPLAGTAFALQILHSYLSRGFLVQKAYELRSFYSDVGWGAANYVGAVITITILGSVILLVLPGRPWLRLVSGIALVPMMVGMAMLVSRGTIVAVALGLVALLVTVGGRHRWKILVLAGLGTALVTQLPVFKVILLRFTAASQSYSYAARVVHWTYALNRFLTHPVLGVGIGQGRYQHDDLLDRDPHNYFLSVASEMGIIGFIAWIVLLIVLFRTLSVAARTHPDRSGWAASLAVLAAIAVLHSCYEPTFAGAHYFFVFFWVATVLYRAADPIDPASSPITHSP